MRCDMRTICIVTATRAEYGLLRPVVQKVAPSSIPICSAPSSCLSGSAASKACFCSRIYWLTQALSNSLKSSKNCLVMIFKGTNPASTSNPSLITTYGAPPAVLRTTVCM